MPRPKTAMIVDDEAHVRVLLRMLLKQLGVETVYEAPEGNAALELAAANNPEVILLDINMPQVGGLEVLERLKAAHPKIPVIIVSSQSTMRTVLQSQKLGAQAYVLKHAPKAEVMQMISDAFDEIANDGAAPGGETQGEPGAPA